MNTLAPNPEQRRSVLVVDDEPGIRTALTAHFTREGWQVVAASGVHEAEYRLAQSEFDLLVSDVRLPDGSGAELLRAAQTTPVVLMTAFATVPDAVEAIRCGARDYLTKPVEWTRMREIAERFAGAGGAMPGASVDAAHSMVGQSGIFQELLTRARAAARTGAHVLIEGEPGTGKKLLARFIHQASDRAGRPFTVIPCAASMTGDELLGSPRTGSKPAEARGGTLLLHGVERMPLELQAQMAAWLARGEWLDVRVIATASVSLRAAVDRGAFRSDLHYRLSAVPLMMPALRERREDIAALAAEFARVWAAREGRRAPEFAPEAFRALREQDWHENVRGLERFLGRVFSRLREGEVWVGPVALAIAPGTAAESVSRVESEPTPAAMPVPIRELERMHLERTLELTRGNRTHAAEMLGISLRTVRNKIREYGLPPRRYA